MRIARFYQRQELSAGTEITLDQRASHHVVTVLRLGTDDRCTVFNGDGHEYPARIVTPHPKHALLLLTTKTTPLTESNLAVHLAQAVSKGQRMDYSVQKAAELGAVAITPILTDRVVVKLDKKRWEKKLVHWQNIVIAACEQSYRVKIPQINPPMPLGEYLAKLEDSYSKFMLDTVAKEKFSSFAPPATNTSLLVGPEGGFADEEIALATKHGFQRAGFGPRILRTETVAPAALAVMQSLWGDV